MFDGALSYGMQCVIGLLRAILNRLETSLKRNYNCHDCTGFHSYFRLEFEESIIGNLMKVDKSQSLLGGVT